MRAHRILIRTAFPQRWTAASFAIALVLVPGGCRKPDLAGTGGGRLGVVAAREVRVLLVDGETECRVRIDSSFVVRSRGGEIRLSGKPMRWTTLSASGRGVRLGDRSLGIGPVDIVPDKSGSIRLAARDSGGWGADGRYPGILRVDAHGGALRVINLVDIETYVACVLPGELFPDFQREAYRAQSVAARTYVLYQMARKTSSDYDVDSTQRSQVYPGLPSGAVADRAREAVQHTRGIVATWSAPGGERIFCTYYSSCCGGTTQSVANWRNDAELIPPLNGGTRCDCLSAAGGKRFYWGPVRLSASEIAAKLPSQAAKIGRVDSIEVLDRTPVGRAKTLRLTGPDGRSVTLMSETFRLAVGSMKIRSTHFNVRRDRDAFVFTDGRGFGHASGLCQWGMEAMARRGFDAGSILKHYYPGMHLTRAY